MKYKYQRLDKIEKSKIKNEYLKTIKGKSTLYRLKRVQITGIICIVFAIIILAINMITEAKWYEYVSVGALIITGLIFIYTSNKIRIKELNKIAVKKKQSLK